MAHRGEVLDHVVGHLGVERPIDRVRADGGHHQGVAISGRLGHEVGANVAARARFVVHHHGLPKRGFLREQTRQDVGRAPAGEGDDQADGFGGEGRSLCLRGLGHQDGCRRRQERRQAGAVSASGLKRCGNQAVTGRAQARSDALARCSAEGSTNRSADSTQDAVHHGTPGQWQEGTA